MKKFDDVKEYRKALISHDYTSKMIMNNITIPNKVYKYRSLNPDYLKDSIEGKVYFSLPSEINANDDDDCKVNVDENKCIEYLMMKLKKPQSVAKNIFNCINSKWIEKLQDTIKIGCFTKVAPGLNYMWEEFADNGKGYCVEYDVYENIFYPDNVVFLPVCYDRMPYDNTDFVIRIIDWVLEKMDKGEKTDLDASFVPKAYNRTIFKLDKYKREEEWRVIIPCNRYENYFDNNMSNGGIKDMRISVSAVYVRKDSGMDISYLNMIKRLTENMNCEFIVL